MATELHHQQTTSFGGLSSCTFNNACPHVPQCCCFL